MPDEPNKKMDEMLRAYAEERRKAANLELHPATRNVLQGEVTRVFGRAPTPRWWKRLRAFWPQLAFGGSLCLILGIAVLSLRQPPPTEQKNAVESSVGLSDSEASKSVEKKADQIETLTSQGVPAISTETDRPPIDAVAPPENRGLEPERTLTESRERNFTRTVRPQESAGASPRSALRRTESAPAVGREATLADIPPAERETLSKAESEVTQAKPIESSRRSTAADDSLASGPPANKLAVSAPAPVAALPGPAISRAVELTNLGAARRLNFVQLSATNSRAGAAVPAATPVLAAFQVEQFGTNVRFLDRDGSVYVGALEPAAAFATLERKDGSSQNAGPANYSFRVQGTNLSLGTDLLFTGQYFEPTNSAPTSLDTFAIAPRAAPRPTNQARHLIIGNATIGATNQVPVRAVSSGP